MKKYIKKLIVHMYANKRILKIQRKSPITVKKNFKT